MASPNVAPVLARVFVSVKIDADRAPSATALARRYQSGSEGLPWFAFIGTDGKGNGPSSKDGQIAYVFRIVNQFDIRRAYNPATGEELNVIEENSSDRPWAQRNYVRVDFSKNLNTSAYELDSLALTGMIQGGIDYEAVGYNFTDPADPNAPQYDIENGYFDVTDVVLAKPQMVTLPALAAHQRRQRADRKLRRDRHHAAPLVPTRRRHRLSALGL